MELSIVIPSKSEPYLEKTVQDLWEHSEAETEVLFEEDTGIGQRMTTNNLVKRAQGKYIMKVDAHCSFSQGFDKKLLAIIDDKTILAPLLLPLDAEQWVINGHKQMAQFVFDTNFVMQHVKGDAGETMCLQGSAWMVSKDNYWAWNLGDESMPSWGGQGTELGIKAFLNGGRCMTTAEAYYGHLFRHEDKDFPYERGESPGKAAIEELKRRYLNKSIAPLIEKFNYPADWDREKVDNLPLLTEVQL